MFQQGSHHEYTVQQPFAWLKKAILVIAIAGFIAVIWYAAANRDNLSSEELTPQLVQAPDAPIKERPESRGGMEVPHQDKKVFNLLEDESVAADTEVAEPSAAPTDETPEEIKRQAATAEQKAADIEKSVQAARQDAEAAQNETPAKAEAEEDKMAQSAPAAKPAPTPTTESATGWGVQLGSFRSRDDARKAVGIFDKKFGTMLDGLTPVIREAQLSQGTFYRVSFVGLESSEAARNLCSAFKQRNQGCLHVNLK